MTNQKLTPKQKELSDDELAAITDLPFTGNSSVKGKKRAVLLGLLATGTVAGALRHSGLIVKSGKYKGSPQRNWWTWWTKPEIGGEPNPKYDPTFVQAVEQVHEVTKDTIRAELFRRAVTGWERPVWGQDGNGRTVQVGTERVYDSRLLQWLGDHVLPEGLKQNGLNNLINIDNRSVHIHANPLDGMSITQKRMVLALSELDRLEDGAGDRVLEQALPLMSLARALADVASGAVEELADGARAQLVRLVEEHLTQEDVADLLPRLLTHKPLLIDHRPAASG